MSEDPDRRAFRPEPYERGKWDSGFVFVIATVVVFVAAPMLTLWLN